MQACSSIKSCSTCCKKTRGCWKLRRGGRPPVVLRIAHGLDMPLRAPAPCTAAEGARPPLRDQAVDPTGRSGAQLSVAGAERDLDAAAAMVGGSIGGGRRTCDVLVRVACGACRQCGRPSQRPAPSLPSRASRSPSPHPLHLAPPPIRPMVRGRLQSGQLKML